MYKIYNIHTMCMCVYIYIYIANVNMKQLYLFIFYPDSHAGETTIIFSNTYWLHNI